MLHITLYRNVSENNCLQKTLSYHRDFTGTLRDGCSIMSPIITFQETDDILYSLINYNYAKIKEFDRYYYIEDLKILTNNFVEIYMSVDVLMSFSVPILSQTCFISRTEDNNHYSTELPDAKFPLKNGNNFFASGPRTHSNILKKYYDLGLGVGGDALCFCLTVANNHSNVIAYASELNPFNDAYLLRVSDVNAFLDDVINATVFTNWNWLFANPTESLISLRLLPLDLTNFLVYNAIDFNSQDGKILVNNIDNTIWIANGSIDGDTSSNPFTALRVKARKFITISWDFTYESPFIVDFLLTEPYCNIQMYLPYYGFIDIQPNLLYDIGYSRLWARVTYNIDVLTGDCIVTIKNTNDDVVQNFEFNISIEIPIGRSNQSDIARDKLLLGIKTAGNVLGAVMTKGATASSITNISESEVSSRGTIQKTKSIEKTRKNSGDFLKVGGEIVNEASNITSEYILASQYRLECGVFDSGYIKCFCPQIYGYGLEPYFVIKAPIPLYTTQQQYSEYAHLVGIPCQKTLKLSNVHGYTEVCGVHLHNIENLTSFENGIATKEELSEIENLLKSGIILP